MIFAHALAVEKRKPAEAIKEAAEVLGNTPAVCKSSYIDPTLLKFPFERTALVQGLSNKFSNLDATSAAHPR